MKRTLIAFAIMLALVGASRAQVWLWSNNGGLSIGGAPYTPPAGNDLLLESGGSNYLLLEDGSSKLCLESGC
jgi:hypothetical protein